MVSRPWIALVVLVSLAGCSTPLTAPAAGSDDQGPPSASEPVHIGEPRAGMLVVYESSRGTETIEVKGLVPIDGPGFRGNAVWLHYELHRSIGKTTVDDYVGADGRRVLTSAPCAGLGLGFSHSATCPPETRRSGSYLAQGLPALRGAALWWGMDVGTGSENTRVSWLGGEARLGVRIEARGTCRVASIDASELPPLVGQRFGLLTQLASTIAFCDTAAFPSWYELDGVRYERTRMDPGMDALSPDPVAPAWGIASTRAAAGPVPPEGAATTPHMSPREAVGWIVENTPEGARFHGPTGWVLRHFSQGDWSRVGLAGQSMENQSQVRVELEDHEITWSGRLDRRCGIALPCSIELSEERVRPTHIGSLRAEHPESLPVAQVYSTAERLMGRPVIFYTAGTVLKDVSQPDIPVTGFHYTFNAAAPDSGVPYTVRTQGTDGTVYAIDGPWESASRTLGLPLEY